MTTTSRRDGDDDDNDDRTDQGDAADRYDGPWKAAIQRYTEAFMALLFPAIHACIEWSNPPEFLDQELQRLTPDASQPAGAVDRLIRLRRTCEKGDRSGGDTRSEDVWVLVHIEVQAQRDQGFMERMFRYHYRILLGVGGVEWSEVI